MHRLTRSAGAILTIGATVLVSGLATSATADPLASARARAAALTKTVDRLNTQAEVVTERYDATEAELNVAIGRQVQADQALTAVQSSAAAAKLAVTNRARDLYESGGDPAVLASLLAGNDPVQAVDRYQLAGDVLAYQSRSAHAAAVTLAHAHDLVQQDTAISSRVTRLQVARQSDASRVESLLATQQRALAAANGTVRQIMRADEAAEQQASAASFLAAVRAAGGSIDMSAPATPPNATAAAAIAAARSRIGMPYVWGATGPDSFDCSGLTQWSYAHAGIALPRTAAEQWTAGPHPSLADLEPGDLLFYALNTSDPATIHHVTMYIGHGMMIAAPHTGENVQIQPVYMDGFIGAMRPWAKAGAGG
jgi:cell wall-associated NlpC family hydrolase